jgi:CMP-N,N'-diacetyllegionaminic acid synthase
MSVLALIPARSGSKGIPRKNFRMLGDRTLVGWAAKVAREAGIERRIVSTDEERPDVPISRVAGGVEWLERPAELCQDDTPMIAVVQHALEQIPGPDDQIIVLLQPTQPLRTVAHVQTAIARLRETQADSVVGVVELPKTHSPDLTCKIEGGRLWSWWEEPLWKVARQIPTRQQAESAYMRDGTVYAFWRRTAARGTLYGSDVRPLIIPPDESCELDTMEHWHALEARFAQT